MTINGNSTRARTKEKNMSIVLLFNPNHSVACLSWLEPYRRRLPAVAAYTETNAYKSNIFCSFRSSFFFIFRAITCKQHILILTQFLPRYMPSTMHPLRFPAKCTAGASIKGEDYSTNTDPIDFTFLAKEKEMVSSTPSLHSQPKY